MKKYLGVTLVGMQFHMCKSGGQFHPNLTWVIPLRSANMDVRRMESMWRIMIGPHDIEMEGISKQCLLQYHVGNLKHKVFEVSRVGTSTWR
jgi:hypothetical protein